MPRSAILLLLLTFACKPTDDDADGFPAEEDCDDADAAVHPGAPEACNGADDDCDGLADDADPGVEVTTGVTSYADADADGFGDAATELRACAVPAGRVTDATDCDDAASAVNPGAAEVCGGEDDDCDGLVDDLDPSLDAASGSASYADADGDGFGDASDEAWSCERPPDRVADASDCDDARADVHPAATEVCGGLDDDCDGLADDADPSLDASTGAPFYADADDDGFGDPDTGAWSCVAPVGYVADATDCDDASASVSPDGAEICGGTDEDCDSLADDADPDVDLSTGSTWHADADGDGYGDATASVAACAAPTGHVADAADCVDTDAAVNPGAAEICGGADDDCDGLADDLDPGVDLSTASEWYGDGDGDGHGDAASALTACDAPSGYVAVADDCDPVEAAISPSAREVCEDGIDQDCNGADRSCTPFVGTIDPATDAATVIWSTETGAGFASGVTVLDFDGDGDDDLAVGASYASGGAGAAYVYAGPLAAGELEHDTAAAVELTAAGTGLYTGSSVWNVGDLDGDGDEELYVGSSMGSDRGVVMGGTTGSVVVSAVRSHTAICYVARPLGDSDADGTNEWGCGNTNVAIYEGYDSTYTTVLNPPSAGTEFLAEDFSGDGEADYWVGAQVLDCGGVVFCGGAHLYEGPLASGALSTPDLTINGDTRDANIGATLGAGDLDGDGYLDILLGSMADDAGVSNGGSWYGWSGPISGTPTPSTADLVLYGDSVDERLGGRHPHVRDVDEDGTDDVLFVSPWSPDGGTSSGAAWLFYAPAGTLTLADAATDGAYFGASAGDQLGSSGSFTGDLTGDGLSDLVLGAPSAAWDANPAGGVVYVLSGG